MVRVSGLFLVIVASLAISSNGQDDKTLGILYWGDLRSAFFGADQDADYYIDCKDLSGSSSGCFGGIAKVQGQLNSLKDKLKADDTLNLHTGGFLGGETGYVGCMQDYTEMASILSGKYFSSSSSNYLRPDYTSVGISDLEGGLTEVENYLDKLSDAGVIPVVSNCKDCDWKSDKNIKKLDSVTKSGVEIGIVGFVNPLANDLTLASTKGSFQDPDIAIRDIIKDEGKDSHNFYIAIGSGNFEIAKSIIDRNDKVSLVIYGGGVPTNSDFKDGLYKYKNRWIAALGSKYGQYVGGLKLTIKDKAIQSVTAYKEKASTSMDDFEELLSNDKKTIECREKTGYTTIVQLGGVDCWKSECNLGNLIADAMVHCAYNDNDARGKVPENTPILSVWHGGAMFRDVVRARTPIRPIDFHRWLPYHNIAHLVKLTGKDLSDLFEISAEGLQESSDRNWGQFLQVSTGMQVSYRDGDFKLLRVLHPGNDEVGVPQFTEIDENEDYWVVIPSMMLKKKAAWQDWDAKLDTAYSIGFDDNCLTNYVAGLGHIATGFEERIFIDGESVVPSGDESSCSSKVGLTIFLTLLVTAVLGGVVFVVYRFVIMPRRANGNWFW